MAESNDRTSWSWNAFESICLKHIPQIKKAMGIKAIYTEESVWRYRSKVKTKKGAQIDLLIDRNDGCITICEMKFSAEPFTLTKTYATELSNKVACFQQQTGTRKTVFLTMVTTYGVKNIESHPGLIQSEVLMDALFDVYN